MMLMLRRVAVATVTSALIVLVSAAAAWAVPGTVKVDSLRSRSVARAESVAPQAETPPPPPRHFEAPTSKNLPHTGPALPAPLTTAAGGLLVLLGVAGLGLLRRLPKGFAS